MAFLLACVVGEPLHTLRCGELSGIEQLYGLWMR
jgi:hypothetical protein